MTSQPMKRATLIALSIECRTRKKFAVVQPLLHLVRRERQGDGIEAHLGAGRRLHVEGAHHQRIRARREVAQELLALVVASGARRPASSEIEIVGVDHVEQPGDLQRRRIQLALPVRRLVVDEELGVGGDARAVVVRALGPR